MTLTLQAPPRRTPEPPQFTTAEELAQYTRDLVAGSFLAENLFRQADRDDTALTMSGLGGCTRAAAYATAGTPATNLPPPEEARQALLGTWIHEHLLPRMAEHAGPDAVYEKPVRLKTPGLEIDGTLDFAYGDVVWDIKSVKEWRLHGVRRRGTYSEHRIQVLGYALAEYQAGRPVRWVCWIYIDRSTGEVHIEVERFSNAAALAVIDRVRLIRLHSESPDDAPREARGPGISLACDSCPWLTRCWGPTAVPGKTGAQRTLAATQEGIEEALKLYADATEQESAAKKDKEFAKVVLDGTPDGEYGAYSLAHGASGEYLDQEQVRADYAARGVELPMKTKAGSIRIKPVAQKKS